MTTEPKSPSPSAATPGGGAAGGGSKHPPNLKRTLTHLTMDELTNLCRRGRPINNCMRFIVIFFYLLLSVFDAAFFFLMIVFNLLSLLSALYCFYIHERHITGKFSFL